LPVIFFSANRLSYRIVIWTNTYHGHSTPCRLHDCWEIWHS